MHERLRAHASSRSLSPSLVLAPCPYQSAHVLALSLSLSLCVCVCVCICLARSHALSVRLSACIACPLRIWSVHVSMLITSTKVHGVILMHTLTPGTRFTSIHEHNPPTSDRGYLCGVRLPIVKRLCSSPHLRRLRRSSVTVLLPCVDVPFCTIPFAAMQTLLHGCHCAAHLPPI